MATAILIFGLIGIVVGIGMFLVYGGGFRSGTRGHPEVQWGRSGQRVGGGGISPPLMLISGLVGFGSLLLLVALLMAIA